MSRSFKLANQSVLLIVEAPGGVYNADQLQMVAGYLDEEGLIAKVTEDQRLSIAVTEDQADAVTARLTATGLGVRPYRDGLHQPVACLGAQCPMYEQDALEDAFRLSSSLSGRTLNGPLRIGLNGCAESCVPVHTLDISIIGEANGYRLSLGGKNSQIPEIATFVAEGIPADKLEELVGGILDTYQAHAKDDETLQAVIERVGISPFAEVLAPYSQDAADDSDPFGNLMGEEPDTPAAFDETTFDAAVDIEAELLSELSEENESGQDDTAMLTAESTDEAAHRPSASSVNHLDDLDVQAGFDANRDLSDELLVQSESEDAMLDIDPNDLGPSELGDDVLIADDTDAHANASMATENDSGYVSEDEVLDEDLIEEEMTSISDSNPNDNDTDNFDISDVDQLELEDDALDAHTTDDASLLDDADVSSDLASADDSTGPEDSDLDFTLEDEDVTGEIDELAESELEGKLEDSIAEQVGLGDLADANLNDRNAALELVGDSDYDGDALDLNSFDQEASLSSDLESLEADYTDETIGNAQGAFSELAGINFEAGRVRISFATGAKLNIDFQKMRDMGGRRTFNIDGQQVEVRVDNDEIFVSVDGVEVNLAIPAAA